MHTKYKFGVFDVISLFDLCKELFSAAQLVPCTCIYNLHATIFGAVSAVQLVHVHGVHVVKIYTYNVYIHVHV